MAFLIFLLIWLLKPLNEVNIEADNFFLFNFFNKVGFFNIFFVLILLFSNVFLNKFLLKNRILEFEIIGDSLLLLLLYDDESLCVKNNLTGVEVLFLDK